MYRFLRPSLIIGTSIACATTSLAWLAPAAQATRAATVSAPVRSALSVGAAAPTVTGPTSPTGASDVVDLGAAGWRVQSSATATQSGAQISAPSFDARS